VESDETLRRSCPRSLSLYSPQHRTPEAALSRWSSASVDADVYGDGGVVREVEKHVAALLGKPAAVFMPTGTMAQQIALRVHADRRASRRVVFHPLCHIERNEERALEHLHGLLGCPVGAEDRLLRLADLQSVIEPIAALVLELPQRMIGAQLPSWPELVVQTSWARDRGAAVHLDGARLWEAQPFYGRPHAEIADLFDTVYVSFYKGLGGIGGCALAGPEEDIEQARVWRTRHGGLMYAMWPYGRWSPRTLTTARAATPASQARCPREPTSCGCGISTRQPWGPMRSRCKAPSRRRSCRRSRSTERQWRAASPQSAKATSTRSPRQRRRCT